jgi:uncharacterized membrane protein YGL010W
MKTLTENLSQYAAYHRNPKNIATHLVGIPMIVLAVVILLERATFDLAGLPISLATVAVIAVNIYYMKLDIKFGYAMSIFLLLSLWIAQQIALQDFATWLTCGLGLFIVGWIFQFIGHYFEGKKPAFMDDIMGLLIGPLFVAAELAFMFKWRLEIKQAIEAQLRHR